MKKLAILFSAFIAGSAIAPIAVQAKNEYPVTSFYTEHINFMNLSEKERMFYAGELEVWRAKIKAGYANGEYDWDFDLNGKIEPMDSVFILQYANETKTGKNGTFKFDEKTYAFTDEMRVRIAEDGDINSDGTIDETDSLIMLFTLYSDVIKGDLNRDGIVDARDASIVLSFYSNMSVNNTCDYNMRMEMILIGDMNNNNMVEASDASIILAEYSANSTRY